MTEHEFQRWYRAHVSAFPSVHAWMEKFPSHDESGPSRSDVLSGWFETMTHAALRDCLEATKRMNCGDEEPPRFPDEHARAVRRVAAELNLKRTAKPVVTDWSVREESFACLLCRDKGIVVCWHPLMMAAMRRGVFSEMRTRYKTAVRCNCKAGDRRQNVPCLFEPQHWVPADWLSREEAEQNLREWAENYKPTYGGKEWGY